MLKKDIIVSSGGPGCTNRADKYNKISYNNVIITIRSIFRTLAYFNA